MKNRILWFSKLVLKILLLQGGSSFSQDVSFQEMKATFLTDDSALVQSCFDCHGVQGNSSKPIYPSIAGLPKDQLEQSLFAYRELRIKSHKSEMMSSVVESLSDEQLIQLAEYFSRQEKKDLRSRRRGRK